MVIHNIVLRAKSAVGFIAVCTTSSCFLTNFWVWMYGNS